MKDTALPSPNAGSMGHHLRRVAAQAISTVQVTANAYGGIHPRAATLVAFFDACSVAAAQFTLAILTLATPTFAANASAGTVIGAIGAKSSGSTLSLAPANTRFAISGSNLTVGATPSTAGTYYVTVRETKSTAVRDTTFKVIVT